MTNSSTISLETNSDDGVHYGIKQGIELSRSNVLYFKHNDMQDLERVLQDVREKDLVSNRKLNRRFIVVEGLYQNYGDVCALDKVYDLAIDYKYRLILDDSLAFGVLGKTGRGTPEHFHIQVFFFFSLHKYFLASFVFAHILIFI